MTTEIEEKKYFVDCDLCGDRIEASKLVLHKAHRHNPHPSPHEETPPKTTNRFLQKEAEQIKRHRELIDVLARIASATEALINK